MRFTLPGQKQPTRLDTLKGDYTEEAIRERIAGRRVSSSAGRMPAPDMGQGQSLLIDIEAKLREGKGPGVLQYRGCKSYTLYFIRQHTRLRHTNGL
jgi:hypothetical protein